MWRLIRAELGYQGVLTGPVYGVFLALQAALAWAPRALYLPELAFSRRAVLVFWFLFYLAAVSVFNSAFSSRGIHIREKRYRLLTLLPVSAGQVGTARALVPVLEWAGLAGILLLFLPLSGDWGAFWTESAWPQTLLALSGAFFLGTALGLVMEDLRTLFQGRLKIFGAPAGRIFYACAVASAVAYFAVVSLAVLLLLRIDALEPAWATAAIFLFRTWPGAALFLLAGATLLLASVRTFGTRRAYLE